MIYALKDGDKIEARPNSRAKCTLCENEVFSKCGEINIWHWAHFKDESCDSWYEPESEWHKNWKSVFGKECSEIVIRKENVKHIADIFTKNEIVVELQNSPIQKDVIRRRETFYGEKMMWILNGIPFKNNFIIRDYSNLTHNNNDINVYDYSNFIETPNGIFNIYTGEKVINPTYIKGTCEFTWYRPKKSWEEASRNIFIDFGENDLFWVVSGMGSRIGRGKKVSKIKFLEKYGGDVALLNLIINKR